MELYDKSTMSVEQRLELLEGLVESLLLDKAMSPIENSASVGPDTHTFPILTDGGGSAKMSFLGNGNERGDWKKTDHLTFTSGDDSNVKVTLVKSITGSGYDAKIDVYYV